MWVMRDSREASFNGIGALLAICEIPVQLLYASSIKTILLGKVALDSPACRYSQTDGDD
jgi:hypothetical protein